MLIGIIWYHFSLFLFFQNSKNILTHEWKAHTTIRIQWQSSSFPSILRGTLPLCAPPQHRLAVHYLIAAYASLAERLCNRKELSRISVTRSFLLHKKSPTTAQQIYRTVVGELVFSITVTALLTSFLFPENPSVSLLP